MSKKRGKAITRLRKQLDKMRVAFALASDHVEQLQALHDEDVAAIEHPKSKPVSIKGKKGSLPKGIKSGLNYIRG